MRQCTNYMVVFVRPELKASRLFSLVQQKPTNKLEVNL